jgi:hypothetical protein
MLMVLTSHVIFRFNVGKLNRLGQSLLRRLVLLEPRHGGRLIFRAQNLINLLVAEKAA